MAGGRAAGSGGVARSRVVLKRGVVVTGAGRLDASAHGGP